MNTPKLPTLVLTLTISAMISSALSAQEFTGDWPEWGRSSHRHNAATAKKAPTDWAPGEIDRKTGEWLEETSRNIKWSVPLGSVSFGAPVVADGRIFVGTNNGQGYLQRAPSRVDLGCLLCFREADGEFLWQLSREKLTTGRVNDWPMQGLCSSPCVEGDRLWIVTNRCELLCLDTHGMHDGKDDGPVKLDSTLIFEHIESESPGRLTPPITPLIEDAVLEMQRGRLSGALRAKLSERGVKLDPPKVLGGLMGPWRFTAIPQGDTLPIDVRIEVTQTEKAHTLRVFSTLTLDDQHEADVVWSLDMISDLGVFPHNMSTSSPTIWGDLVFLVTSNGVDESHVGLPAPTAPSFIAVDKRSGKVVWSDNSPGANVLHGQWASPAAGVLGGVPQVIFPGGDGWLYSFHAERHSDGKPELLWKFDCNPKASKWTLGGRGTRNNLCAAPLIHDQRIYITVGQDPEHGEGAGALHCIDPTQRGDVSAELVVDGKTKTIVAPARRYEAIDKEAGEVAIPNPNSALIWSYREHDQDRNGEITYEEAMHRSLSTPVIKDNLLFVNDFSGLTHCVDIRTGLPYWTYDLFAACWSTPLLVNDRVYVGDEDGDVLILHASADPKRSFKVKQIDPNRRILSEPLHEITMNNSLYLPPVMANGVLYLVTRSRLYAIEEESE